MLVVLAASYFWFMCRTDHPMKLEAGLDRGQSRRAYMLETGLSKTGATVSACSSAACASVQPSTNTLQPSGAASLRTCCTRSLIGLFGKLRAETHEQCVSNKIQRAAEQSGAVSYPSISSCEQLCKFSLSWVAPRSLMLLSANLRRDKSSA
eukprot:COSAG02_NODE_3967_length_5975_cov_20.818244_1_plen_151_part_00